MTLLYIFYIIFCPVQVLYVLGLTRLLAVSCPQSTWNNTAHTGRIFMKFGSYNKSQMTRTISQFYFGKELFAKINLRDSACRWLLL